jgi:exoribonuclease R
MSTKFKIHIEDRNYSSWKVYELNDGVYELNDNISYIEPLEHKLFNNDCFTYHDNESVEIAYSPIRSTNFLPAVLIIHGNKTYGRRNGKLLYKCIPDDQSLPSFLIPYDMKHVGFSKVYINLYVNFHFVEWREKHPIGQLDQVIGPVDVIDHFYEYQLYCKNLNTSIQKFQKDTSKALQKNPQDAFITNIQARFPSLEDRTDQKEWNIFTIDPEKSTDFDDAFSIKLYDPASDNKTVLSIYISNVSIWMDVLNLWDSFAKRISTIYLPDRKRSMIPPILSDGLCSLQSNNTRIALVLDLVIQNGEIVETRYSNCTIRVAKNYVYEEPALQNNSSYQTLLNTARLLSEKYKYISTIQDSHDVVSYLMILMNHYTAREMLKYKNGIFRSAAILKEENKEIIPTSIPEESAKLLKIMKSSISGKYLDLASESESSNSFRHDLLELDAYIHITSPIRRLVDLLNIIQFQENAGLIQLSEKARDFYRLWIAEIDFINSASRSTHKVQLDCSLLNLCVNHPQTLVKEYDGYVFDKSKCSENGLFHYFVFLPELKLSSRIVARDDFMNYDHKRFRLYVFQNEEKFKKKIRLQMI